MSFIRNCERALTKQPAENNFNGPGFVVLPYLQDVSEETGRILKQQKVKVASTAFFRAPAKSETILTARNQAWCTNCTQCNFVYYGQTERS